MPSKYKVHKEEEKEDRLNMETSRDEETKSNKEGKTKSKKEKEIVKLCNNVTFSPKDKEWENRIGEEQVLWHVSKGTEECSIQKDDFSYA